MILIIGILAAIAIPSFLNQRRQGHDASARNSRAPPGQAAETYATDHGGNYAGIEPPKSCTNTRHAIPTAAGNGNACLTARREAIEAARDTRSQPTAAGHGRHVHDRHETATA